MYYKKSENMISDELILAHKEVNKSLEHITILQNQLEEEEKTVNKLLAQYGVEQLFYL